MAIIVMIILLSQVRIIFFFKGRCIGNRNAESFSTLPEVAHKKPFVVPYPASYLTVSHCYLIFCTLPHQDSNLD